MCPPPDSIRRSSAGEPNADTLGDRSGRQALERESVRIGREPPPGSSFLTPLTQVTDRTGHSLHGAPTGVEIAAFPALVGNTPHLGSRQSEPPLSSRAGGCTGPTAVAWKSSPAGAESVRPASAGRWLGKTRRPAALRWESGNPAAPICGQSHSADFDVAPLVRTSYSMSSWAGVTLQDQFLIAYLLDVSTSAKARGQYTDSQVPLVLLPCPCGNNSPQVNWGVEC